MIQIKVKLKPLAKNEQNLRNVWTQRKTIPRTSSKAQLAIKNK